MSDVLLGFVLGCILFGVLWPYKGAFWMIRELRNHVRFLANANPSEREESDGETVEIEHSSETLAEKRP